MSVFGCKAAWIVGLSVQCANIAVLAIRTPTLPLRQGTPSPPFAVSAPPPQVILSLRVVSESLSSYHTSCPLSPRFPLDFCQTKCYDTYARQNRR
nr:MAG TPA: hypothetical protein [Caudoviricetes sp.]